MNALASPEPGQAATALLELYDDALPQVHGYLLRRCRARLLAEDLTGEVFLAAVRSIRAGKVETVTVAWLIGIARHKLVDHWRAEEREERRLKAIAGELGDAGDDWDEVLDRHLAEEVLAALAPQYRAALTLRYLDAMPVANVAEHLDRTLGATEALLTRAKAAFRAAYDRHGGHDV
ncbi:MAG: sigma-70 family RNA polymerase sigma factor [Actinomycetota bacterium]